jgi:hypothetical protein
MRQIERKCHHAKKLNVFSLGNAKSHREREREREKKIIPLLSSETDKTLSQNFSLALKIHFFMLSTPNHT